jgi:4-hydroxyphenylpyruvate dioxygenase-like putative hemolysin
LTRLEFVHVNEINTIEGLSDWLSYFEESNKESWWDEEWATSSKNQIIQDALHIHKIDLEKVDNELLKMVSDYFNNFLN